METTLLKIYFRNIRVFVARVIKDHATGISLNNNATECLCLEFRHIKRQTKRLEVMLCKVINFTD